MDDSLEQPTSISKPADSEGREEDEQSSGDDDEGPDWTKLPSAVRPVIPKRGDKDFEPNAIGGSGLQRHVLDRARAAMADALSASRTISSKSASYGVWYPEIARAHVTIARGIHFATMGHSVARTSQNPQTAKKVQKRLELLPEEALYLVERGAMFCWKAIDVLVPDNAGLEDVGGIPMSVQEAFSEMIGREDLTLEKYQVFAYLKRLGYVVTRAKPPTTAYPIPPPWPAGSAEPPSLLAILYSVFSSAASSLARIFSRRVDWWHPLRFSRWFHHNMDNRSVFESLRFLQSGHSAPLRIEKAPDSSRSPYNIFFNLFKPSTPFKKTAPPPPDFCVVVVNARTTPMPTLPELAALFDVLPELPPPVPRKRMAFAQMSAAARAPTSASAPPVAKQPLTRRLFAWAFPAGPLPHAVQPRPPNPFLALKSGKKIVVVAAVDAGMISFFRFGQGVFSEWPMQ